MTKFDAYYTEVLNEISMKKAWPAAALAGTLAFGQPAIAQELPKKPAVEVSVNRGVANNNPGNIRKTGDKWLGMTGDDGQFVKFSEPLYGIRAMARLLRSYTLKHGINTLEGIISKWAPSSENKTAEYIQRVSSITNLPPDQPLNLFDLKGSPNVPKLKQVIRGIMQNEIGKAHENYPDDLIEQAIGMI